MTEEIVLPGESNICGIIMPISETDGCSRSHWEEVRKILAEAITSADFYPQMVSDDEAVNVIQRTIVQNVYDNDMVICDISAKNPNVMFELGMRLTFDKPTVIVKDGDTESPFDVSIIKHIEYPRDLHYYSILQFKKDLTKTLRATHHVAKADKNYSPFISHFGEYKVTGLHERNVGIEEFIIKSLSDFKNDLKSEIRHLRPPAPRRTSQDTSTGMSITDAIINRGIGTTIDTLINEFRLSRGIDRWAQLRDSDIRAALLEHVYRNPIICHSMTRKRVEAIINDTVWNYSFAEEAAERAAED